MNKQISVCSWLVFPGEKGNAGNGGAACSWWTRWRLHFWNGQHVFPPATLQRPPTTHHPQTTQHPLFESLKPPLISICLHFNAKLFPFWPRLSFLRVLAHVSYDCVQNTLCFAFSFPLRGCVCVCICVCRHN